jgi:hypothetical protein
MVSNTFQAQTRLRVCRSLGRPERRSDNRGWCPELGEYPGRVGSKSPKTPHSRRAGSCPIPHVQLQCCSQHQQIGQIRAKDHSEPTARPRERSQEASTRKHARNQNVEECSEAPTARTNSRQGNQGRNPKSQPRSTYACLSLALHPRPPLGSVGTQPR